MHPKIHVRINGGRRSFALSGGFTAGERSCLSENIPQELSKNSSGSRNSLLFIAYAQSQSTEPCVILEFGDHIRMCEWRSIFVKKALSFHHEVLLNALMPQFVALFNLVHPRQKDSPF
jgi:hypothetical protein